jgi:type IV pilus assembly protein PilA
VINIALNAANVGTIAAGANTLLLSPYVNPGNNAAPITLAAAAAANTTGSIDWVCSSLTHATATARNAFAVPQMVHCKGASARMLF